MIESIVAAIAAIGKALASIFGLIQQQKLVEAGRAQADAAATKQQLDELRRACAAREKAQRDAEIDLDSDDGFRRD